jgi:hypothetical protein
VQGRHALPGLDRVSDTGLDRVFLDFGNHHRADPSHRAEITGSAHSIVIRCTTFVAQSMASNRLGHSQRIPFLPGYCVDPAVQSDFRKTHHFDHVSGSRQEKSAAAAGNVLREITLNQREPVEGATDTETKPILPPDWIRFDGVVCRFYAFIQSASAVRKFIIYFYMEDSSLQVIVFISC